MMKKVLITVSCIFDLTFKCCVYCFVRNLYLECIHAAISMSD
jgi:hypothetical protein